MGASLVLILFILTAIGKRVNEPFTLSTTASAISLGPDALLEYPLQDKIQAQENVGYGQLNQYRVESPMASYAQITNNRREWTNPENGTALYPPINGTSMYKKNVT